MAKDYANESENPSHGSTRNLFPDLKEQKYTIVFTHTREKILVATD